MQIALGEGRQFGEFGVPGANEGVAVGGLPNGCARSASMAMAGRSIGRSKRTRRSTDPSSSIRLGAPTCTAARPDWLLIMQQGARLAGVVQRFGQRQRLVAVAAAGW